MTGLDQNGLIPGLLVMVPTIGHKMTGLDQNGLIPGLQRVITGLMVKIGVTGIMVKIGVTGMIILGIISHGMVMMSGTMKSMIMVVKVRSVSASRTAKTRLTGNIMKDGEHMKMDQQIKLKQLGDSQQIIHKIHILGRDLL